MKKCDICNKELDDKKICKAFNKLLCPKHYQQILKYGHVLDNNPRSQSDLNDYNFIDENTIEIICFNKKSNKSGSFLISPCDFNNIITKKWRIWKNSVFTGNYNPISYTSFILNPDKGYVVDHINGDRFDNRRENLRICKQQDNLCNKHFMSNNKSGFIGITYSNERNKWCAEITKNNKKYKLGRWDKIENAVYARYFAEKILFGKFRNTLNDYKILNVIQILSNKDKKNIRKTVSKKLKMVNLTRK